MTLKGIIQSLDDERECYTLYERTVRHCILLAYEGGVYEHCEHHYRGFAPYPTRLHLDCSASNGVDIAIEPLRMAYSEVVLKYVGMDRLCRKNDLG